MQQQSSVFNILYMSIDVCAKWYIYTYISCVCWRKKIHNGTNNDIVWKARDSNFRKHHINRHLIYIAVIIYIYASKAPSPLFDCWFFFISSSSAISFLLSILPLVLCVLPSRPMYFSNFHRAKLRVYNGDTIHTNHSIHVDVFATAYVSLSMRLEIVVGGAVWL